MRGPVPACANVIPPSTRTVLLTLVAILLVPSAAAAPIDRVPTGLAADTASFRSALDNASKAEGIAGIRAAVGDARQVAPDVVPHLVALGDADGALLAELWRSLRVEARAGNASNARSLAAAAVDTLEDDLQPRVQAWDANRTTVTPGVPKADGDVPVLLIHPPSAGMGAFDVRVTVNGSTPPKDAAVAVGQGESRIDRANRSARLASFDAQALAGLGTGARDVVVLGHVSYPADAGTIDLDVDVLELVDPDGRPIPAVSPSARVDVATGDAASGIPTNVAALVLVGGLGVVAVVAIRRVVRW